MSTLRQAARQALEALEGNPISHAGLVNTKHAITALRQALAEPEQEPVAWLRADGMKCMPNDEKEAWLATGRAFDREIVEDYTVPLYTAPNPQPEQPVAWMCSDESLVHKGYSRFSRTCEGAWNIPVYTATTPRKPVELTDEECDAIYEALDDWAREFDSHSFGLPRIYRGHWAEVGRVVIRRALGITGETK